ncbi:MAG TPA: YHS domain-containing protein [Blastocatellia bacterium]|nr:YHS domain-containing protein [Blastocatellia bacterium]
MAKHLDPVCGMQVEEDQAVGQSEYLNQTYYFCSQDCKTKFDQDPESYVVRTGTAARRAGEEPSL